MAMPVATGISTHDCVDGTPKMQVHSIFAAVVNVNLHIHPWLSPALLRRSSIMLFVSLFSSEEPAALGCTAEISPDRPIPWPSLEKENGTEDEPYSCTRKSQSCLKCLSATIREAILASRSPTPTFSDSWITNVVIDGNTNYSIPEKLLLSITASSCKSSCIL